MKPAIILTAFGLLLAGIPASAQAPHENHWDISKIDVTKLPAASDQKDVTFDKDILPLFKASCVRCHGSEKPRGGLRLDDLEAVLKGGKAGKMVVPGDSKNSLLVVAAARIDDSTGMPPKHRPHSGPPPGGPGPGGNTNAPAGGPGGQGKSGPPPKPLTTEEVGLVRAWIDQGAK
jgi:mono/diheme cytochrome c family protein